MGSFDITRLKRIVKNTINMIDKSREAIYDIAEGARRECHRLEEELKQLKIEVERIIIRGEELEQQLKQSRMRLALISKNFDKYTQDDIRQAYESADKIRIELAVNREREKFAIVRRNDLERRLKEAYGTVEKAEQLVNQVGTVMDYLSGDLSNLDIHLEDTEKRKYLAIRIIKAQEEERNRVAREIHDGPAQMMSNVVLKAEICEKLIDVDLDKARAELKNLKNAVRDSLKDVRRIIYDLKPMSLEDLGLIPTLQKYIEKFSSESGIDVRFQCLGADNDSYDKNINLTVFRVVQEALNNIRKHSNAKTADVKVEFTPTNVAVRISDKGKGFDTNLLKVEKDDDSGGFGIFSMKERIELLNGTLDVNSKIGKGTTIKVLLPHSEG
ncbi:MAG TPA: histidine kinase [Ruminiclostridium sp.]|nr:sensor histidine kinase [Clostridiaceae bacterium]HAA25814.1 histidine kinase [Ruminiclostridium sp.]